MDLRFNMNEDVAGAYEVEITGMIDYSQVNLRFNKISGELKGYLGSYHLELRLTNCDL